MVIPPTHSSTPNKDNAVSTAVDLHVIGSPKAIMSGSWKDWLSCS